MTGEPTVAQRAGTLGVLLKVFGTGGLDLPSEERASTVWGRFSSGEWDVIDREITAEELALGNACLALEAELLAGQFAALERLLPLIERREHGALDWPYERRALCAAALAAIEVGWVHRPPHDPVPRRRPRACGWRRHTTIGRGPRRGH